MSQTDIYATTPEHPVDASFRMDPILSRALEDVSSRSVGGILEASKGLQIWKKSLAKGRLPQPSDFLKESASTGSEVWPPEPLFQAVFDAMVSMQLPRLVLKHPECASMVVRSLLRWTVEFSGRLDTLLADENNSRQNEANEDDLYEDYDDLYFYDWGEDGPPDIPLASTTEAWSPPMESPESIAQDIAKDLINEWGNVVHGVNLLDQLFGLNHGLLQEISDEESGNGGSPLGFGLSDGVWSHTGWEIIPQLQKELSDIPELQDLIRSLGRRPSAEESDNYHKFTPRKLDPEGGLGAELDPLQKESVNGIAFSGSLTEMLPSEAVLLRGHSKTLRNYFLAKQAEAKLLSYQLSGWVDVPSVPRTKSLYQNRLPSAPGGPIIVCLDTSWSMSGRREALSKAVVLAAVSQAHKQKRDCQVVAFSTENGVVESGVVTPDNEGIQRLLAFLTYSFGGGTDVTGALKFAMENLEKDVLSAADILLVTDGEIPDPPVSEKILDALDRLKLQKGVEVHGLLVGRSESKPLSRLCSQTHDFLTRYDSMASLTSDSVNVSMWSKRSWGEKLTSSRGRRSTALFARKSYYDDNDGESRKGRRKKKDQNDRWDDTSEDFVSSFDETSLEMAGSENGGPISTESQKALDYLRQSVSQTVEENLRLSKKLEEERSRPDSGRQFHDKIRDAIGRVEDGLVERGEEARLVVLAMIASEHILLLGKPGTGKSILGLRLAELCDGRFFQRLLTRFTTPEELFGPLSLKSLENDEYRRCTEGFLPTSEIAFLDEIFKANSAILNTMLTILNERKFDNAGARESCPIRCVIGASNELPESEELVALFDRFLIRKEVIAVSDEGVMNLLSMANPGETTCSANDSCNVIFSQDLDAVIASLSRSAATVTMDIEACELMRSLRVYMREQVNVEVSDRRLVKAARLLKIAAASDGRSRVDMIDFLLLQHCFWDEPVQRTAIREWLWENLTPMDHTAAITIQQSRMLLENLRNDVKAALRVTNGVAEEDFELLRSLRNESEKIVNILQQQLNNLARHTSLMHEVKDNIWLDVDDTQAVEQLLLPRAESLWADVLQTTEDAYALSASISQQEFSPPRAVREEVIDNLWEKRRYEREFSEVELSIPMKEAKSKYDLDTFRRWKRAKKKMDRQLQAS